MVFNKFECSKCGECCRHINYIPELKKFDSGNGACINLRDNLCTIYDNRPGICRVDIMYERTYKKMYTREEFYRLNKEVCKELKNTFANNA